QTAESSFGGLQRTADIICVMNRSTGIIRPEVITNDYPGAFRAECRYNDEPDVDGPCGNHDGCNGAHPCCQDECCGLGFRGSHGYSMIWCRWCNRFWFAG
ncbi:MAG: hypothetical protein PHF34_00935, partial [Bacteroidales bacterium]|nr:hypothetical protein [Bacteroidales bacterium]